MKKSIMLSLLSISTLIFPISVATSCSNNDSSYQNEANEIYKSIWKNVNNKELAIDSNQYSNSIYDFVSFKKMTKSNEIKNVPTNEFNVIINNFDYSKSNEGKIKFEISLQNVNDKKIYRPVINEDEEYFSNIIEIGGFKPMEDATIKKLDNVYQIINNTNFKLNQKGIDLVLNNNINIKENINFNDPNNVNYFLNMLQIPEEIKNSEFDLVGLKTNIYKIDDAIEINENDYTIKFNFWLIVALKSNKNIPLAINFGLNNDNGFTNNKKTITIGYKPSFKFNLKINDIDANLSNSTIENIKQTINAKWIYDNKNKLFVDSSLDIIEENKINNINLLLNNNILELSFDFVINNSLSYQIQTSISGFKA